jgi:TetR/AcrR family transcriptional regulator, regulator of autoinduction and epiphytic fitness
VATVKGDPRKAPRPYRSPRREAQARATREAIIEAALRRFLADGYARTTIDAIAGDADVSAATVYGIFGSKPALLSAAIDASVRGDDEDTPLAEQDWVKGLATLPDSGERLRAMFAELRVVYERTAGIERVVEQAASTDGEIAELAQGLRNRQREDAANFRSFFVGDGVIFPGLDAVKDRDAIWALTGQTVFRKLVEECGWSPKQWERWVVDLCERLLST